MGWMIWQCEGSSMFPRRGIGAATIEKINVYAVEHNVSFLDALLFFG